ncbi:cytochrome P450 [Mycobacterium intracellulare]|uniref:cytochrome P450 n=1 Tax=Mycobacterium intracellulare TaxID=1767 RepID=UPI0004BB3DAC|nr:cytochrome P450 [Mycobacterium intracellulare]
MSIGSDLLTRPDLDFIDGEFYAGNSRQAYGWMRAHEPVFRDRNGLAGVATYRAVLQASRNPELFSNTGGTRPDHEPIVPAMIDMDDPLHLQRRKLVNTGFSHRRVHNLDGSIRGLCDRLIDSVCERGECDFVRDLARPLPMAVIGDMLGVQPDDHPMLLEWSDVLMTTLTSRLDDLEAEALNAFAGFSDFSRDMISRRRKEPTDDLISVLTHAEIDGEKLSDDDIVMETLLILLGGDETTRHVLTGGTEQLLRDQDSYDRLRRDTEALLPTAVEEMLRWTSPVKNMCRLLTADAEFHGTSLRKGEKVMLLFESANFDEQQFPNPETFDIERRPNNHLAFGFGPHFCMGNQLARLEISLMTRRLIERLPDLRLASDDALPLRPANFISGVEKMPVVFTPTKPVTQL